ncbi:MAG: hypothetical protein QM791_00345 [Ferruginibacter sp.]
MSTLDILILIYGYASGGILIYLLDHGMDKRYLLICFGIATVIFLCYAIFSSPGEYTNVNYGFLTLPIIAPLAFIIAAMVSWRIHEREFRATWRGARYFYTEKKSWSDYLLSFFVIWVELGWPIIPALLFRK